MAPSNPLEPEPTNKPVSSNELNESPKLEAPLISASENVTNNTKVPEQGTLNAPEPLSKSQFEPAGVHSPSNSKKIQSDTSVVPLSAEQNIGNALPDMRRHTRRAFFRGGIAAGSALISWNLLRSRTQDDNIPWPLREVHRFNEWLWKRTYSNKALAPEFPKNLADEPKPNGRYGWPDDVKPSTWKLTLSQPNIPDRTIRLSELHSLPRMEMTTELKCIEGWSQIVTWSGFRFVDFLEKFNLGRRSNGDWYPYVSLTTDDLGYYVGLDILSAIHPQTILCDTMNGEPLPAVHGAPLRLVITVKYGIKNIKWLSTIQFQEDRPADFWAEQGYDWYSGL